MKRNTLAVVICASLAVMTGIASARDEPTHPALQGITVQHHPLPYATADRPLGDCTPPSTEPNLAVCQAVAADLRRNFTDHEIQMIFGAWSHYPEYLTSYAHLSDRYQDFLRNYMSGNTYPVAQASR